MRCVHEASLYDNNCFITLTYDDDNLPPTGSLIKKHYQDFMKRLRHKYTGKSIRYYHCGEYGELSDRPHYHACLFNHDFEDKIHYSTRDDVPLYTSPELNQLWPAGFNTIGAVTFESAAYVARYIMKKVTGEKAEDHYQSLDTDTGEITSILPEYTTMSRRPGIGADWYNQWKSDTYPSDSVIMNGKAMRPPRFYDTMYELTNPEELAVLKQLRKRKALEHSEDQTTNRLRTREKVKTAQTQSLKGKL